MSFSNLEYMVRWVLLSCFVITALFGRETKPSKRLRNATTAFSEVMAAPDKGIPPELMDKAQCVVIVPGLKKGAFGVGASMGADSRRAAGVDTVGARLQQWRLRAEVLDCNSADRRLM